MVPQKPKLSIPHWDSTNQAASQAPQPGPAAADGGGCTDAAGPRTANGGGGGGTDAQVNELARKISAMEAQIEQLEQRNGVLEENFKLPIPNLPLS